MFEKPTISFHLCLNLWFIVGCHGNRVEIEMMKDAQNWRFFLFLFKNTSLDSICQWIQVFVALETVACNFNPSLIWSMGQPQNFYKFILSCLLLACVKWLTCVTNVLVPDPDTLPLLWLVFPAGHAWSIMMLYLKLLHFWHMFYSYRWPHLETINVWTF